MQRRDGALASSPFSCICKTTVHGCFAYKTNGGVFMAESVISICNKALGFLGQSAAINSLTENSVEANICRRYYDGALASVLSEYPWRWAEVSSPMAPCSDSDAVRTGFSYVYTIPAGCVHVLKVVSASGNADTPLRFSVGHSSSGRILFCDVADAIAFYTFAVTDPTEFPPLFAEALVWRLAAEIVVPITGGNLGTRENIMKYYQFAFANAVNGDANEFYDVPSPIISSFEAARNE